MDAQRNLYGHTTEFAWTHNGICIDAQQNLHGPTMDVSWTHNFYLLGQKNHIHICVIQFMLLRPNLMDQQQEE